MVKKKKKKKPKPSEKCRFEFYSFAHFAQLMTYLPASVSAYAHDLHFINLGAISPARCRIARYLDPAATCARANAGFDPRIAVACFAYVTSSVLLSIGRYAGASRNPKPGDFGYEAFRTPGFRAIGFRAKVCHARIRAQEYGPVMYLVQPPVQYFSI